MTPKKQVKAHVSEAKKKRVAELSDLIKNNKTILVASIKNIPASQFQEIVKKLRGKALVTVPKKSLIFRAINASSSEEKEIEKLKEKITESVAILFSNLDTFDLASELVRSKRPAKAKPGQVAPEDIKIPKGPTDLVPGPAISELGDLGIPIQIEKGKIHIKQEKVVAKEGEKISGKAAEIMSKLNIRPFLIGFTPLCAFDNEKKKLYTEIKIDPEKALRDIKHAFSRALPFAVEIGYISNDTITFLLGKAGAHEKTLKALLKSDGKSDTGKKKETEKSGKKVETKETQDGGKSKEEGEESKDVEKKEGEPEEKKDVDEEKGEDSKREEKSESEPKEKPEETQQENKSQEEK